MSFIGGESETLTISIHLRFGAQMWLFSQYTDMLQWEQGTIPPPRTLVYGPWIMKSTVSTTWQGKGNAVVNRTELDASSAT